MKLYNQCRVPSSEEGLLLITFCWPVNACIPLKKKKGKVGYCAVKIDMHKAYGRMELRFLYRMMERLGFHIKFIDIIMACGSSVKYKVVTPG